MTPEQVFSIVNTTAMVAWLALLLLPGKRWVTAAVTGIAVPTLFAVVYTAIIAATFYRTPGGFSTLADVATLFSNPWLLLAGWIHYLAFDLLIGTWETQDARQRGLPHLLVVPCLVGTFLFGPAGWLLYIALRATRSSQMRHSVSSAA